MTACISEPVSWLRLERYWLDELPAQDAQGVAEHLAACTACRACYAQIEQDARPAPELQLPAAGAGLSPTAAGPRRGAVKWYAAASLAAALALGLFATRATPPQTPPDGPVVPTTSTKGKFIVALELVRVDNGGKLREPSKFASSDRFKLLISCTPETSGKLQVRVFQAGEVYAPLPTQAVSCGNRRQVDGALQLDGDRPADVCVAVAPTFDEINAGSARQMPKDMSACVRVEPE